MNWNWVDSRADLYDFLAQVIICAPDNFIEVDYLPTEDQLDLEKAFAELNRGMVYLEMPTQFQQERLQNLLTQSLQAYRQGDSVLGAHLLQDFERIAFT